MAKYKGNTPLSIKRMGTKDAPALILLAALGNGSFTREELQRKLDCDFYWLVDAQYHLLVKKNISVKWSD